MVTLNVPGSETVVKIKEGLNTELVVRKQAPYNTKSTVDLGRHLSSMTHSLKMTHKKDIGDMASISHGRFSVELKDATFIYEARTCMPPIEDVETMLERYKKSLSSVVYHKLAIGA